MPLTNEQFFEIFKNLPEEVKELLSSTKVYEVIESTSTKYGLSDEQEKIVKDSAEEVLLGILPAEEFPKTLKKMIKSKNDIEKMGAEISRLLFFPINSALKNSVSPAPVATQEETETKPTPEAPAEKQIPRKDSYREPII